MKTRLLFLISAAGLLMSPQVSFGQAPPPLGAAASFALFTAVGAIDNNGPSVVNGDIGTNAGAFNGFPPGVINGNIHVADTRSTQAATAVQGAYGYMSSIVYAPVAVFGGTPAVTMVPGAYTVGGASTLAGTLILDGGNNPNATFYLQVTGALTTAQNSQVLLTRGANANNVYWQIGGLTTLGQNSVMQGTLLVDGAIIMIAGAQLTGRGLSRAGAITLTSATASLPGSVAVPVAIITSWLGSALGGVDTNWFNSSNWSAGVPTSTVDAIVPANASPYPVISSGNAVANALTIGTGASLTQSGGTLDLKSNLNNNGTISATAGSVTLSGSRTQVLAGTGATQLWSLTIANPAGALQTGAVSIHGVLTPATGSLTTNGQPLTLLSDAAGTALVDNSGTGTVNGAATVQRYIDPSLNTMLGYRQYSAPVANTTLADLATPGFTPVFSPAYNASATPRQVRPFPTVFGYDETRLVTSPATDLSDFDKGYFSPQATDPMAPLTGYTVNIGAGQVVDLRGTLNNGPLSRNNLTRGTGTDAGWQLLGNPYPSPIDLSRTAGVTRTNLDDAVYVFQSSGAYTGQYRSYVNGVPAANALLSSSQAFFVRVSAGQTTGGFGLNNSVRVTTLTPQPAFNRSTADVRPLVQLRLESPTALSDDTYVYFEQGATAAFDARFDAYKLPNSSGLSVGSLITAAELSINGLAPLSSTVAVPLNVRVPSAGTYTLRAASLVNFGASPQVFLLDTQTGARINLSQQPSYSFQAGTTVLPGRFSLSFGAATGPLANVNAGLAAQVQLFPNPAHGTFALLLPAGLGQAPVAVRMTNALGQLVSERTVAMTAAGASVQVNVSALAPGVYSVHLSSAHGQVVKRVVVE